MLHQYKNASTRSSLEQASHFIMLTGRSGKSSRRIVRVFPYVALRQVAPPYTRGGFADTEVNADYNVRLIEIFAQSFEIAIDGRALLENRSVTEANRDLGRLNSRVKTLAHCHDHAAPIRITAVNRCLYQRRIDYRLGDTFGLCLTLGAIDIDRDELGSAFTTAGDLTRQHFANIQQPRFKLTLVDGAGETVRHQHDGVAGARIGVDAHG